MADLYRYAAFISYSSKDAAFARRLHRALESYGIPSSLGEFDLIGGGGKKNRIYPVFRDREELSAGHLGDQIEANLKASAALIVVCSPNAAQSPWVQKEIEYFAGSGRADKIFAIVTNDAPATDEQGRDATPLCFPPAFRGDALSGDKLEPLAADARRGKDGFRNAWLKIVAGMIGVSPGQIIDRDRAARRARAMQIAAGLSALVLGVATLVATNDSRLRRLELLTQARQLNGVEGRTLDSHAFAVAALGRDSLYAPGAEQAKRAAADAGLETRLAADLEGFDNDVEISPNGAWLQANNGQVSRLWNLANGRSEALSRRARFVQDGLSIALQDRAGVLVRDLRTRDTRTLPFPWTQPQNRRSLSAKGPFLVAADGENGAVWDLRTGAHFTYGPAFGSLLMPHQTAFVWQGRNQTIANVLANGRTVTLPANYEMSGGIDGPRLSAADQRFVVDVSANGRSAGLIDLSDGSRRELQWPAGAIPRRVSDDGAYIILRFPAGDNVFRPGVLDVATGAVRRFVVGDAIVGDVRNRVFAPGTHSIIAFLMQDSSVHLLDVAAQTDVKLGDFATTFTFSPDGRYAFGPGIEQNGLLLDVATGRITSIGVPSDRADFVFTPQGAVLFSGTIAETRFYQPLNRIDVSTHELRQIAELDPRRRFHVSPTGRYVTAVNGEGVQTIIDLQNSSVRRFGQPFYLAYGDPVFAEQRNMVALLGHDQWVAWDLDAPKPMGSPSAWAQTICAQSGQVIRPFAPTSRTSSVVRGRPWHACDWRGMLSPDGWAQALRYWAVRLGASWDYAPDECTRRTPGFGCPRDAARFARAP